MDEPAKSGGLIEMERNSYYQHDLTMRFYPFEIIGFVSYITGKP